jgi:CheY-like chemotaxis protein
VIVSDIFMPEMEGIETIHDLLREFPEVGAAKTFKEAVQVRRPHRRGARPVQGRFRPAVTR